MAEIEGHSSPILEARKAVGEGNDGILSTILHMVNSSLRPVLLDGEHYWDEVARYIGQELPLAEPSSVCVVVQTGTHATQLMRSLSRCVGGRPACPPRIRTWAALFEEDTWAHQGELDQVSRLKRWWTLHTHLEQSPVGRWFGRSRAQRLLGAEELLAVADEWLLAKAAHHLGGLDQAVERALGQRAWRMAGPEVTLVESVAAFLADSPGGATQWLSTLERLHKLSSLQATTIVAVFDHLPTSSAEQLQCRSLERLRSGTREICLIAPDASACIGRRRVLSAAWPEILAADAPLNEEEESAEQESAQANAMPAADIQWLACAGSEEAAQRSARAVSETLGADPSACIALVALDRHLARRVRALLERAGIHVKDETGWKLSTSSAATSIMRLIDVLSDERAASLLDTLQHPFVRPYGWSERVQQELIHRLDEAVRSMQVVKGLRWLRRNTQQMKGSAAVREAAETLLDDLIECREVLHKRFQPQVFGALLHRLGMRDTLRDDAAGAQVLSVLDGFEASLQGAGLSLAVWRSMLGAELEARTFSESTAEHAVCLLPLSATRWRHFDRAVLLGCDERQLPAQEGPSPLFFTDPVRKELGLQTSADRTRQSLEDLALLLARTARVDVVWQYLDRDEPIVLSPWLARLKLALPAAAMQAPPLPSQVWQADPTMQPRPFVAHAPQRWSAHSYQTLLDCPYRYFVKAKLGLKPLDEVDEEPDKRAVGQAVHDALYAFHRDAPDTESIEIAHARLLLLLKEHFLPLTNRNAAFEARLSEAQAWTGDYIALWFDAQAKGWRWQEGESERSVHLETEGEPIQIFGRIDRIDQQSQADKLPRVVDYKTGSAASLREKLRNPGEQAQLPFYGLLMQADEVEAGYLSLNGSSAEWIPHPDFSALLPDFYQRFLDHAVRLREGVQMPAHGPEAVCRHCEARGLCRKGYWPDEELSS